MPHIIFYHNIEHITPGLNTKLAQLNKILNKKTGIGLENIKSRAVPFTYGAIAERESGKYVHIEVILKDDKSEEIKNKTADSVLEFAKNIFDEKTVEEITLELREFNPDNYRKIKFRED